MAFSGAQIAGNISGSQPTATGKAIRSVTGAASNADRSNSKSQTGDKNASSDEVAATGKADNNSKLINEGHSVSRLTASINGALSASAFGVTSPSLGMFAATNNPLLNAMGFGASSNPWGGAAVANTNPNYDGDRLGPDGDPAPGGIIGNVDPLYKGSVVPKNITVLGASDSGSVAYGDGSGTAIANYVSSGIARGQSLGNVIGGLNGRSISTGGAYQTPHLTSTGSGLSKDSFNASSSNRVSGTGIVLVGEDGSGEYHVGIESGAQKIAQSMRAVGLNVVFARNEQQYKDAVLQADSDAKASGGKTLLWVHGEAHGNSNRAGGGHRANDIGFISVGGGIDERNLIGHAAYAHESHKDVLFTTGACHSGAIDANQTFAHLDRAFQLPPAKKEEPAVSNQPKAAEPKISEPKVPEPRTSNVENGKAEPSLTKSEPEAKAPDNSSIAKLTDDEKAKRERNLGMEVEIA